MFDLGSRSYIAATEPKLSSPDNFRCKFKLPSLMEIRSVIRRWNMGPHGRTEGQAESKHVHQFAS